MPLPPDLLRGKFIDCAKRALSPAAANRLFGLLEGLETVNRISTLTAATVPETRLADAPGPRFAAPEAAAARGAFSVAEREAVPAILARLPG
jgi:hypothetical protein